MTTVGVDGQVTTPVAAPTAAGTPRQDRESLRGVLEKLASEMMLGMALGETQRADWPE